MPKVRFVETRQIRRNHKTLQWRAGETYEYDKEMQPMIDIGHATLLPDVVSEPEPEPAPAKEPERKPEPEIKAKPEILKRSVPDPLKTPTHRGE